MIKIERRRVFAGSLSGETDFRRYCFDYIYGFMYRICCLLFSGKISGEKTHKVISVYSFYS